MKHLVCEESKATLKWHIPPYCKAYRRPPVPPCLLWPVPADLSTLRTHRWSNLHPHKHHKWDDDTHAGGTWMILTVWGGTLYDSQQDNNHKEEKGDVKQNTVEFIRVARGVLDFISNTSTSTDANVHVKQVTLKKRERDTSRVRVTTSLLFCFPIYECFTGLTSLRQRDVCISKTICAIKEK